jgi:hypothetical protein
MTTRAPLTAAPRESMTTPLTEPVVDWARGCAERQMRMVRTAKILPYILLP